MTEKDINQYLKNGMFEIAPNCFDDIMEKISSKEDTKNSVITDKRQSGKNAVKYIASVAACFCILTGSVGIHQYEQGKVTTIVQLDVNPSIEFCVNKSDKVVKVTALNGDGEEIVENLSLKRESIEEATLSVMDELVKKGFVSREASTVLVSVENENQTKTEEIKEHLSGEIVKHLEKEDIEVTVLKQTIVKDETAENIAKEYNISNGKALLVKAVIEENADLKEEQLAKMTVDEIAEQSNRGNVNLEKILNEKKENSDQTKEESAENKDNKKETVAKNKQKKCEVTKAVNETEIQQNKNVSQKEKPQEQKNDNILTKTPTKTPEGNKKPAATKTPEGNKKPAPTKTPEGNKKPAPTKMPEGNKKPAPTKAPEGNKKPAPTKAPEDDRKPRPTKVPEDDRKPRPTKMPEDDRKPRATKVPEDDRKPGPTRVPEEGKEPGLTMIPEDDRKPRPRRENGVADKENKENQKEERK